MTNKRMLINATQTEELRVAIVETVNQKLLDLIVERESYKTKAGNIYLGKVTSVEPSLDAVFVNFGSERHGFLPMKEISKNYFNPNIESKNERPTIRELIKEGQSLMIQVEKEERGNKGAALTTFISLAGSYLVLMPNNPRAGGISRRVEGEDREELRDILSQLTVPENMGVIVRTAGVGKTQEELQWDLNSLLRQWEAIQKAIQERAPPFLIHQESDVIVRTIRDYLRPDITEILVDDNKLFEKIKEHLTQIRPDFVRHLKSYQGAIPLFSRYQVEHQIETAHQREVRLPSGGSIVIDHTEALVAIDVNSARATKGGDIEETAFNTNLEAAEEIARQLRLRDIGGLIIIDFIDMSSVRHRREVENHLRHSIKQDKARTQLGSISSRFGLLEMSRQRLRHSLGEATQVICPRCNGWGTIRGIESLALSILRMIEEDSLKANTSQIQVQAPIEVATFIMNEKRHALINMEKTQKIEIVIIPNAQIVSPNYKIKRITEEEATSTHLKDIPSYDLLRQKEAEPSVKKPLHPHSKEEEKPAVKILPPGEPAPVGKKTGVGLLKRFLTTLFGGTEENKPASPPPFLPTQARQSPQKRPHTSSRSRRSHSQSEKNRTSNRQISDRPAVIQVQPEKPKNDWVSSSSVEQKKVVKSEDLSPMLEPTPTTTTTEQKPLAENTIESKNPNRRGTRGGKQRSHSAGKKMNQPETEIPPSESKDLTVFESPTHLPPFPADLEEYYQKSIPFSGQPRSKKGESSGQSESVKKSHQNTNKSIVKSRVETQASQSATELKSGESDPIQSIEPVRVKASEVIKSDSPVRPVFIEVQGISEKQSIKEQPPSTASEQNKILSHEPQTQTEAIQNKKNIKPVQKSLGAFENVSAHSVIPPSLRILDNRFEPLTVKSKKSVEDEKDKKPSENEGKE